MTNYVVEKQEPTTGDWKPVSKFVRKPECDVYNLEEGKPVRLRVRAENQHGLSEPLELTEPLVPKSACKPPGPPTGLEVANVDEDHISLEWQKPRSDGGSRILGYEIECREPGSGSWKLCY